MARSPSRRPGQSERRIDPLEWVWRDHQCAPSIRLLSKPRPGVKNRRHGHQFTCRFRGPSGGAYTAAAGTVIQFGGGTASAPLQADPSLFLLGFGQFQFVSGFLRLPTNVIPNLDLKGGALQLGPGFQGGTITNLTLGGINLTNTLPVTGSLMVSNGSVSGVLPVANGALLSVFNVAFNAQVTIESRWAGSWSKTAPPPWVMVLSATPR